MLAKRDLNWSVLDPSLYSEVFTGRARHPPCPHCPSEDHTQDLAAAVCHRRTLSIQLLRHLQSTVQSTCSIHQCLFHLTFFTRRLTTACLACTARISLCHSLFFTDFFRFHLHLFQTFFSFSFLFNLFVASFSLSIFLCSFSSIYIPFSCAFSLLSE